MLHVGPYTDEWTSIEALRVFIKENKLINDTGTSRKHHEIYLSDPRKTQPEKLKTIIRLPVSKE